MTPPKFGACAKLLSAGTAGNAKRAAAFAQLLAIYIAEKYTNVASQRADYRGGLPIARLRKIEQATAMTPLQFVTRERIVRAILLRYFGGRWA